MVSGAGCEKSLKCAYAIYHAFSQLFPVQTKAYVSGRLDLGRRYCTYVKVPTSQFFQIVDSFSIHRSSSSLSF